VEAEQEGTRAYTAAETGPYRGCPAFPTASPCILTGGPYLRAASQLVARLAEQVRRSAAGEAPTWVAEPHAPVPAELICDVQVWRAATQVDASDLRPTGRPQLGRAAQVWQQRLDKRLGAADTDADWQWRKLLATEVPSATADSFLTALEERLTNLARAGFDGTHILRSAAARGSLPTTTRAAALSWRIVDQIQQMPTWDPHHQAQSQ
jgi:hypothetical protein